MCKRLSWEFANLVSKNSADQMIKKILYSIILLAVSTSLNMKKEWTPLLDKNMSQWDMYLSYRHTNEYNGELPKDKSGNIEMPIGYGKNVNDMFTMIEEKGEPVLRVSGEIYGCVFTRQEYANYHLKLKVKWGTSKFEPRLTKLKDSGILYHSIGESGKDYWRSWMLSQEFQIMEGHMGDYWNIANSAIDIRAYPSEGVMSSIASEDQPFLPFGSGSGGDGFCMRSENHESPADEWTTLELICFEDKSLHIVNGHVVMVLKNSHYNDNGNKIPLTKGKIQLQSEAAEVYFKDIQIKNIASMPEQYKKLY